MNQTGFSFKPQTQSTSQFNFGSTSATISPNKPTFQFSFSPQSTAETKPTSTTTSTFPFGTSTFAPTTTSKPLFPSFQNFSTSITTAPTATSFTGLSSPTSGTNAFGFQQSSVVPAQNVSVIHFNTQYEKLPPDFKSEIDTLWGTIKKQRQLQDQVNKGTSGIQNGLKELDTKVRTLEQRVLSLEFSQQRQRNACKILKEEVKRESRDTERYAGWTIQQFHHPSGFKTVEQLPSPYMWSLLETLENQLQEHVQQINEIEQQLLRVNPDSNFSGAYGQKGQIFPEHLKHLLELQYELFMTTAGKIAAIHERVESLRDECKKRWKSDKFTEADRAEIDSERRLESLLRSEFNNPQQPQQPPQQQITGALNWPTTNTTQLSLGNKATFSLGGAPSTQPSFNFLSTPSTTTIPILSSSSPGTTGSFLNFQSTPSAGLTSSSGTKRRSSLKK